MMVAGFAPRLRMGYKFYAAAQELKAIQNDNLLQRIFGTDAELKVFCTEVLKTKTEVAVVYVGGYFECSKQAYGENVDAACFDVTSRRFVDWARAGADQIVGAINAYRRQASLPHDSRDCCGAFVY